MGCTRKFGVNRRHLGRMGRMNETEHVWDVVVVGAGPSGATCAWKCAERGLSVLLLERAADIPRYKPCGGGIPGSVMEHVSGLEPARFADLSVTHLRHSYKGKQSIHAPMTTWSGDPAEIWMVQRPLFDTYLVEKATAAGAILKTGVRVRHAAMDDSGATLETLDGRTIRARHVVGADGAKGIVGASVGLRLSKRYGIAREMEIPFGTEGDLWHPSLLPHTVYLDYGSVTKGYAWIFPKKNCLSVGAGQLMPEKPSERATAQIGETLKKAMQTIMESVGLALPETPNAPTLHAHPIPYWTGKETLATADDRALLVGDAAGVVQPLFGEGIQYALRTGALAAECLADGTVGSYTAKVTELFAREFDAADRVGRVFHRTPYLSYRLGVKNPLGTALVGRLMAGEASLADLEQKLYDRLRTAALPSLGKRK